jgi:hypothetical protein
MTSEIEVFGRWFHPLTSQGTSAMSPLLHTTALAVVMLLAIPAAAQQGPAGVPGLFDLVESVTSPSAAPPPAPQAKREKQAAADCDKMKGKNGCKPVRKTRSKTLGDCTGLSGQKLAKCKRQEPAAPDSDCSSSADPVRCLRYQKARSVCKDEIGAKHRQCLHDILVPKK